MDVPKKIRKGNSKGNTHLTQLANMFPHKIGIMGPFGFGNLGDAAIQQSVIQYLRNRVPEVEIIGFSLNPEDTEIRHGIKSYPVGRMASNGWVGHGTHRIIIRLQQIAHRMRYSSKRLLRLLGKIFLTIPLEILSIMDAAKNVINLDFFIVSGGGQLDDYWGGAWHHPYTLLLWSILVKIFGAKLLFVSVGAGPLDSQMSRWFVRRALSLADYRSYRDERSKKFVKRIGFMNDDPVYPDLAHSLQVPGYIHSNDKHIKNKNSIEHGDSTVRVEVGIGPMAYFDPRVWPEKDQSVYISYLEKLAQLVIWLIHRGYTIRMFPGEAAHDREVIADFLELLGKKLGSLPDDQILYESVESVDELMRQLSCVEYVVASRFHGVLLAQLVNKPVLALSYHEKIDALMEDTGQSAYCLPIDRFEVEYLKERFLDMVTNNETIKAQVAQRVNQYRLALEEQYERIFGTDHA